MATVKVRSYISPTLVLLAFDWPEGGRRRDFLGFAIKRKPGFGGKAESWLLNRISFDGPAKKGEILTSDANPIQKFQWWDAHIDTEHRGKTFTYTVMPVVGTTANLRLVPEDSKEIEVTIPLLAEKGIGSYFNRAVVSSQAFARKFGRRVSGERLHEALAWLANGLEEVIPRFLGQAGNVEGAIYHLTDEEWVIPALEEFRGVASLVYNHTKKDTSNAPAVRRLQRVSFKKRTKASIMHNKFLVALNGERPVAVLTGSANFTTDGLTTQANLLHTFESPALAELYLKRKRLLENDPRISETAQDAGWSPQITASDAKVRVFFPPEQKDARESLDAIVKAVRKAKVSIRFCLFMPTDGDLRRAIFEMADQGNTMFGLVNKISKTGPGDEPLDAGKKASVEIYHRSRKKKDVYSHAFYARKGHPEGFWWENATLPGKRSKFPVYIHHKFVIIDAETEHPTIYTGSANMSKNALYRNDENLVEIKDCPRLAQIYLAEFMRLYEHYRARAAWDNWHKGKDNTYKLQEDWRWAARAYKPGTPQFKSRTTMV